MITINGTDLYNAVRHLAPIARSSLNPTDRRLRMRCIGDNTIELAAVGRVLTAKTYARFDGAGFDDDSFVDAELLYKLSSRLKKADVRFEAKTTAELELSSGNVTTTFPKSDGPCVNDAEVSSVITIPASLFLDVMRRALPYTSSDDHRPALCGVYLDRIEGEMHVTATNGATLFNRSFDPADWVDDLTDGIVLPDVLVKLALKLADANGTDIEVRLGDHRIVLVQPDVFYVEMDRAEATYPDFRQCIPAPPVAALAATFDAATMLDALQAAAPFVGKSEAVRVVYNGSVQVQVDNDAGRFDYDVRGEHNGEKTVTLSFNRKYLGQMCTTLLESGDVQQLVGGSIEPQLFRGANDDRTRVIVMPMRL